ncbi:MAG: hypothetical protein NVV74_01620 [Magnetospirillum sp.]|nr:hypothetical protein [Magnetospirillum sp.]
MLIAWNDHFAVGIDTIDAGHALVIEAINQLNQAETPAASATVVDRMLPLLRTHFDEQFTAEDKLLQGAGAETRAEHEREHCRLLTVLDVIGQSHAGGGDMAGLLLLNLVCFLVSHLRGTDGDAFAAHRHSRRAA